MKKILIVDDCPETRELIRFTLTQQNYEVIEAGDGEEALTKISAEHPDLIILDIIMPRLDGYTLAEKLKENKKIAKIPIIISTFKFKLKSVFELNKISQVKDFIEKPFLPEHLVEKVKNILDNETE
ncbi:MAG: response regulator [Elusimicrobiota bacterium]